jgi:hypothetical protein
MLETLHFLKIDQFNQEFIQKKPRNIGAFNI